uniref:Nuclease HARBI1 n=1 Tax=Photinus pyralis TaxID=7054 RepID=A0A1Y1MXR4_PHOPY
MDLFELDELFDDNDEEIINFIDGLRSYTVKERKDHFAECTDKEFYDRFRFSKNIVRNVILPAIGHVFQHEHLLQYHEIDPLNQLLITLRFYACGSFYITLGDFIGIHKTTAGRIIKRVTQALLTIRGNYIKFPENEEEKRRVQERFFHVAQFPGVIGAIDCTHVKIQSPGKNTFTS